MGTPPGGGPDARLELDRAELGRLLRGDDVLVARPASLACRGEADIADTGRDVAGRAVTATAAAMMRFDGGKRTARIGQPTLMIRETA